jgi:hypothetical protein
MTGAKATLLRMTAQASQLRPAIADSIAGHVHRFTPISERQEMQVVIGQSALPAIVHLKAHRMPVPHCMTPRDLLKIHL